MRMAIHKRSPQNNWIKKTLKRLPETYCHVVKLTQAETKEKAFSCHSQMFQATPGSTFRAALNETFIKTTSHSTMLPRVSPYQNPVKPPFDLPKLPLPKIVSAPSLGSSTTPSYCNSLPPLLSRYPQNESGDRSKVVKENVLTPVSSTPTLPTMKSVEQTKDITTSTSTSAMTMASSKTYTAISVSQGQNRTIAALAAEKSHHEFEKDDKGQTLITDSSMSLAVVSFSASSSSSLTSTTTTDPSGQRSTPGALRDHHSSVDDTGIDPKDLEKRNRRKFYWYGSHKLIKPIKDIPPRFQLMLAETNAEKARCEGRPIILRQHSDQVDHFNSAATPSFNPDGQCFLPNLSYDPSRLCNPGCLMDRKDMQTLGITTSSSGVSNSTNSVITSSGGSGNSSDPMGDVTPSLTQPVPPMYTLHVYSSACNPSTSGSVTGTTAAGNACCLHLPATSGGPTGGYMSNLQPNHSASMTSPHLQQTPIYFPAQAAPLQPTPIQPTATPTTSYTAGQQTYSAVFPPTLAPTQTFLANPAGMGPLATATAQTFPIPQYTPCVTYTQNAQYTVTAVPQ